MISALSTRVSAIAGLLLASATPAAPCSMVGPAPTPAQLVDKATVIVRARVDGFAGPGVAPEQIGATAQVRFTVLQVLKGSLSASAIDISGALEDRDDPNDGPVPYTFVRPGGRGGGCYATTYRQGAEYLLLLQEAIDQRGTPTRTLTPYWYGLMPTNEQLLRGARDPWLVWVSHRLGLPVDPEAAAGTWPAVQPLDARFEITDADHAAVAVEIAGDGGSALYRLSCRTGDQPPPRSDGSSLVYMGDLDCHLMDATAPPASAENLLRETHAGGWPAWMSRGQMYGAQITTACANYPEYGRVRHFRLRGMLLTLRFEAPMFREPAAFPMLKSYTLQVRVERDESATSDIAQVSGYRPPVIPMPMDDQACTTILQGRVSDIP